MFKPDPPYSEAETKRSRKRMERVRPAVADIVQDIVDRALCNANNGIELSDGANPHHILSTLGMANLPTLMRNRQQEANTTSDDAILAQDMTKSTKTD